MDVKSVFVTGASGGSGFAIAEKFAREGYSVFITSRDKKQAENSARLISDKYHVASFGYELHTQEESDTIEVFQDIKRKGYRITTLVLNAADLGMDTDVLEVPLERFEEVIHNNIVWNYSIARQAAVQMKEAGGGAIVFVGSNTYQRSIENRCAYIASKGGIASLSRALAVELGKYNIRSNTLVMGSIKTVRFEQLSEEVQMQKLNRIPIKNIADFEDMANAIWYLGTNLSKNVTGTELIVDGGACSQLFSK